MGCNLWGATYGAQPMGRNRKKQITHSAALGRQPSAGLAPGSAAGVASAFSSSATRPPGSGAACRQGRGQGEQNQEDERPRLQSKGAPAGEPVGGTGCLAVPTRTLMPFLSGLSRSSSSLSLRGLLFFSSFCTARASARSSAPCGSHILCRARRGTSHPRPTTRATTRAISRTDTTAIDGGDHECQRGAARATTRTSRRTASRPI